MSQEAIYRIDRGRALTSLSAADPWDGATQHGAGPAALVAWAIEGIETR
jgi:hypothetical protein